MNDYDDKIKEVFQIFNNGTRLIKGEWTSDGRKLFNFIISEIEVVNSCGCEDEENKILSGLYYYLKGKGNPPAMIWVYKGKERLDPTENRRSNGIGTFFLSPADEDEEKKQANIEIVLDPPAFDNFVHAVTVLLFKGQMKFRVTVKRSSEEKGESVLMVIGYELENYLALNPDQGKLSHSEE